MNTVENYILGLDGQQRAIIAFLHNHLRGHHELDPKIRWKIPAYSLKSLICYLNPIEQDGVELAFFRGNKLSNAQGVLSLKGRKLVAGIDIYQQEDIEFRFLDQIINEAIILDTLTK